MIYNLKVPDVRNRSLVIFRCLQVSFPYLNAFTPLLKLSTTTNTCALLLSIHLALRPSCNFWGTAKDRVLDSTELFYDSLDVE